MEPIDKATQVAERVVDLNFKGNYDTISQSPVDIEGKGSFATYIYQADDDIFFYIIKINSNGRVVTSYLKFTADEISSITEDELYLKIKEWAKL